MWCIFLVVGLKLLLRRLWLAMLVTLAFYWMLNLPTVIGTSGHPGIDVTLTLLSVTLMMGGVIRMGLLAGSVAFYTKFLLGMAPWSLRVGDWRAEPTVFAVVIVAGIIAYGAWTATATAGPSARRA
jgi:hypothetical protein